MGKQLKTGNQQGLLTVFSLLVIFFALFLVVPDKKEEAPAVSSDQKATPLNQGTAPTLKVGDPVPDVEVFSKSGSVSLADYRGPALFEFLSTDCPYCKDLAPRLKEMTKSYPEVKVFLVGVGQESFPALDDWKRRYGISTEVLLDREGQGVKAFSVIGTPTLVWIDGEGRISSYHTGSPTDQSLQGYFEKATDK